jgi:methylenetetrahydrofolate reductase (NADPH)
VTRSGHAGAIAGDAGLKQRIVEFAASASLEITSSDKGLPASLAGRLPAGTTLYVAHTPNATLADVAEAACIAESAGFRGCPHIVARRIASSAELATALDRLKRGGVSRVLLVAGDLTPPSGEFASTLDILDSGALAAAGIEAVGVSGHPEGNPNIEAASIWEALARKQAYGERTGARVHIVSQFGFDPAALVTWDRELTRHGIALPVHVGVAGPASLKSLAKYAMLCGIGASLGALLTNPAALGTLRSLVKTVDEIFPALVRLRDGALARRLVKPHFFAFGGVMKTVEWLEAVRAGRFDIDADGAIVIHS